LGQRRARIAKDYAAGREDAAQVLHAMEAGQLELLDED